MDAPPERAAPPPAASGARAATPLELAGRELLEDRRLPFRVELAEPGVLGLRSPRGRVVLLEHDEARPLAVPAALSRIQQRAYPARQIVVFGGGPALRRRLAAMAGEDAGLWLLHCDTGPDWQSRRPRLGERRSCAALLRAASRARLTTRWSADEAEAHRRRLERERELARREARELERFGRLLAARRPRATFALMALIGLVFGLEAAWGGVDLPPLLSAMGSLVPERARAGEWWRFFACSFLHGGPLHVGLNLFVLWMLGRSLERAIGSSRFLLVYFGAALAGSVASCLSVEGQSVGASGAIWGLLGAEAALAFYPQPLLPPVLIAMARRTALLNLGINLAASFVPRVDAAAHVGGGLAGALVLALLARARLLPVQGSPSRLVRAGVRALAALLALLFALGFGAAQLAGQPWRLSAPPELVRSAVAGWPWSVELPRGHARAGQSAREGAIEYGDLRHDASVIQLEWSPLPQGSPRSALEADLAQLGRELGDAEGLELLAAPLLVADPERPGGGYVTVRYRYAQTPELVDDWALGVWNGARVRVHVSAWAALPAASEGLAPRILRSLGPASAAGGARLGASSGPDAGAP